MSKGANDGCGQHHTQARNRTMYNTPIILCGGYFCANIGPFMALAQRTTITARTINRSGRSHPTCWRFGRAINVA
jgi:hypothetical protein